MTLVVEESPHRRLAPQRSVRSDAILDLNWMTAADRNPGWDLIERRWEEIYRETAAGDRLGTADLFVTLNVLHLGWFLAKREGRFSEAADRLAPVLEHPDIAQLGSTDLFILRYELAHTFFMSGKEEEALAQLGLLMDEPTHKTGALRHAKIALLCFISEQDPATMASEALTEMVHELVHRIKRRKLRRWARGSKPYGELLQLLHTTVPAKERERVIAEARGWQQAEADE